MSNNNNSVTEFHLPVNIPLLDDDFNDFNQYDPNFKNNMDFASYEDDVSFLQNYSAEPYSYTSM